MKRYKYIIVVIFSFIFLYCFNSNLVMAKEIIATKSYSNIFGDTLGLIQVYEDGEIVISYKYGLRKADVYYCEKGEECDRNFYIQSPIMESSETKPYKNTNDKLEKLTYKLSLKEGAEYSFKIEAYFATGMGYTGVESIGGSPAISSVQRLDIGDTYIKGTASSYNDEHIDSFMDKLTNIVNTVVMPVLYSVISIVFIIKGAILGVQIVKSADNIDIRREKIHALKWLVIGVGIAYAASTVVGLLTGYFEKIFK